MSEKPFIDQIQDHVMGMVRAQRELQRMAGGVTTEDATIEDLSRKLEEARMRIEELDRTIAALREACKFGSDKLEEQDAKIASLKTALKQLTDLINLREWTLQGTPEEILRAFRHAVHELEGKSDV